MDKSRKDRKDGAALAYQQKLDLLMTPGRTEPVTFAPQEYLKLVKEKFDKSHTDFAAILGISSDTLKDLFRTVSTRLPMSVAARMASLSDEAPYNQNLYWLQSEYKVADYDAIPSLRSKPRTWESTVTEAGISSVQYKYTPSR